VTAIGIEAVTDRTIATILGHGLGVGAFDPTGGGKPSIRVWYGFKLIGCRIDVGGLPIVLGGVDVPGGQGAILSDRDAVELLATGAAEVEGKGKSLPIVVDRAFRTHQLAAVIEMGPLLSQATGYGTTLGEEGMKLGRGEIGSWSLRKDCLLDLFGRDIQVSRKLV
jgi:hypothetical protein